MRDMQLLIHATAGLVVVNKGPCGVAVLVQVRSSDTCSDIASYSRIHVAKCLREQIFAGTNFCVLAFDREKHDNLCLAKISRYTVTTQSSVYTASVSKVSLPLHITSPVALVATIYWYDYIHCGLCVAFFTST